MGGMFAFLGSQFRLEVDRKEYFIDLLLFHRRLRWLVAIHPKIGEFEPEFVGKMQFYLTALDRQVILLGVEDDGTITGIQRPNLEEWLMDTVFDAKVHPMMLPFYEEIEFEDGKRMDDATFTQVWNRPPLAQKSLLW